MRWRLINLATGIVWMSLQPFGDLWRCWCRLELLLVRIILRKPAWRVRFVQLGRTIHTMLRPVETSLTDYDNPSTQFAAALILTLLWGLMGYLTPLAF